MGKELIIGVDLGGTKIITGIINPDGDIIGSPVKVPTRADKPAEQIVDRMIDAMNKSIREASLSADQIAGIGIGSPSPIDIKNGMILTTQNLPTLHYYRIKEKISNTFQVPVHLNNDANCFALGESCFGAVKHAQNAVGITLGTGFGCGIIINGKIYTGATDTAAEIDMCPYLDGNLEDYISGRGLSKIYHNLSGEQDVPSKIAHMARQNNVYARRAWIQFGAHLGHALSLVVNLLDPEVIIVGGSMSRAFDLFSEKTIEILHQNINPVPREHLKVEQARLGENAGFIGAACLLLQ